MSEGHIENEPPLEPETGAPHPKHLGAYRIRRLLATGGMSEVFEALDPKSTPCALKVVRHLPLNSPQILRLRREANLLHLLDHPNIPKALDVGEATIEPRGPKVPYIALELIEKARPIDRYVQDESIPLRQSVELIARAADALHHAHMRGVIHRDIKPTNLLVDIHGNPKLIDFGVGAHTQALDVTMQTLQTMPGQLLGTVQYMSPEQVSGNLANIDVRTDIYSLGLILYQLVTGELPYSTAGVPLVLATQIVRSAPIPSPRTKAPRLDRDLEAVVIKALARSPSLRYQTAGAFCDDLNLWLQSKRVAARDSKRWIGFTQWLARHPLASTAVACLLLIVVSIMTAFVTAHIANNVPHHLNVSRASRTAQLRSLGGRVLHEWTNLSSMPGSNDSAVLVPTTDGKNSDTFIALSYNHPDPLDTENLHIVSMGDPEQVIWKGPGTTPIESYPDYVERDIHPETNIPNKRTEFFLRTLIAADVFPEIPGQELVSIVTNRKQFPTAIRIHSLAPLLTGNEPKLLYEVWHPGYLYQIHWHDETGQLISAGVNNRFDYAHIGEPHNPWGQAVVAFAIKPVLNHIESERETKRWLTQYNQSEVGGPTWYSTLSPSSYSEKWIIASIERLNSRDNDGKNLAIELRHQQPAQSNIWIRVPWQFDPKDGSSALGTIPDFTNAQMPEVKDYDWQFQAVPLPAYTEVEPAQ